MYLDDRENNTLREVKFFLLNRVLQLILILASCTITFWHETPFPTRARAKFPRFSMAGCRLVSPSLKNKTPINLCMWGSSRNAPRIWDKWFGWSQVKHQGDLLILSTCTNSDGVYTQYILHKPWSRCSPFLYAVS